MHVNKLRNVYIFAKEFGNDSNGALWTSVHITLNHGLVTEKHIVVPITDSGAGYNQLAFDAICKTVTHIICNHLWQLRDMHHVPVMANIAHNQLKRDVKRWGLYW